MKWFRLNEVGTWSVFMLLGPPLGAVTEITLDQFIFPVPGLLGFYEPGSTAEAFDHYVRNLIFTLPFSYVAVPLALICGFFVAAFRLFTKPPLDVPIAALTGLAIGLLITWSEWFEPDHIPPSYPQRSAFNWTMTCMVPALICGWISRRRSRYASMR